MKNIYVLLIFFFCTSQKEGSFAGPGPKPEPPKKDVIEWSFDTGGQVLSSVAISGSTLFAGSFNGIFYALDTMGTELWRYDSGYPIKSTPLTNGQTVYFQSGNRLRALNNDDGSMLWEHIPKEAAENDPQVQFDSWDLKDSSPVFSDGKIYYGNEYGYFFGIEANSGEEIFRFKTSSGSRIRTKPAIVNNIIYFGDGGGYIYAVDIEEQSLIWSKKTFEGNLPYPEFGGILGEMLVSGDNLYFGLRNGRFQVLNKNTGGLVWEFGSANGTWLSGIPVVLDGLLYIGESDAHKLNVFDAASGELQWQIDLENGIYNAPVFAEDFIIVLTGDESYPIQIPGSGKFFVLSKDGKIIKCRNVSGSVFNTPVYYGGKAYYGSRDGRIYCLNLDKFLSGE